MVGGGFVSSDSVYKRRKHAAMCTTRFVPVVYVLPCSTCWTRAQSCLRERDLAMCRGNVVVVLSNAEVQFSSFLRHPFGVPPISAWSRS